MGYALEDKKTGKVWFPLKTHLQDRKTASAYSFGFLKPIRVKVVEVKRKGIR